MWCYVVDSNEYSSAIYTLHVVYDHSLTLCWSCCACRQAEYEADAIGICLLAKACYDPRANLSMLYKLEQQEKESGDGEPVELCTQICIGCGMFHDGKV